MMKGLKVEISCTSLGEIELWSSDGLVCTIRQTDAKQIGLQPYCLNAEATLKFTNIKKSIPATYPIPQLCPQCVDKNLLLTEIAKILEHNTLSRCWDDRDAWIEITSRHILSKVLKAGYLPWEEIGRIIKEASESLSDKHQRETEEAKKQTRKEIGRWLEKFCSTTLHAGLAQYILMSKDVEILKQGKMPSK